MASYDDWRTPDLEFEALHREFNFACDLAAAAHNARLPDWFGPGSLLAENSLEIPWHQLAPGRWLWINPPFSRLDEFVGKCSAEAGLGAMIVAILPAHRSEQAWWHDHVLGRAHEVRSIRRRTHYNLVGPSLDSWRSEKPEERAGKKPAAAGFASCVAVWAGLNETSTEILSWDPREAHDG